MKKIISAGRLFLAGAILAVLLQPLLGTSQAVAAVSSWQKGASIVPNSPTDFATNTFQQSIDQLADTGADYVSLIIPIYQSNIYSTDIQAGWNTPSDASLISAINYAHNKGLKVMLKPHLDPYDGQWRAFINPPDRTTWFTNYKNFLVHYAGIASLTGAEEICIGTELIDMSSAWVNGTNTQNWQGLITAIRLVYSGKLTYSANWGSGSFANEKPQVGFWSALDFLGISAYYNLSGDGSVAQLQQSWDSWNQNDIGPFYQQYQKPILFTEIGYRSVSGAYTQPWNYNLSGSSDQTGQANDYQALFSYWNNYSYVQGVQLWGWSDSTNVGPNDTSYSPQNKPAQRVMTNWFTGNGTPSPSPPPAGGPPPGPAGNSWQAQTTSSTASPQAGSLVNQNIAITNTNSTSANVLIDTEVYNSAGTQVYQNYYTNQNFAASGSNTYNFSWTPQASGTYTIKAGVFSNDWSQNYSWFNNVGQVNVGTNTPPPPSPTPTPTPTPTPPPTQNFVIQVWWPSNGGSVTGVQPFKAMIQGLDISQYQMYWQVDGGGLNLMNNSSVDYPHKEALVDVTNWNWHPGQPYMITFVAKDSLGSTIATQNISINVQ